MNPRMKAHHKDQLLQALMHYMPMEVRKKVMLEVLAAYNDYYGGDPTVVVCYAKDLEPVTPDPDQRISVVV